MDVSIKSPSPEVMEHPEEDVGKVGNDLKFKYISQKSFRIKLSCKLNLLK